ncbi:MAG: MoaD/ThiS family protein [Candidatus Bathyarchaeia archaeon]
MLARGDTVTPRTFDFTALMHNNALHRIEEDPLQTVHLDVSEVTLSMKRVKIRFYGRLRDVTQTQETNMEVEDNATLGDVFERLIQTYGAAFETSMHSTAEGRNGELRVFVNRKPADSLDKVIEDTAIIDLFPPVAGGCSLYMETRCSEFIAEPHVIQFAEGLDYELLCHR